MIFPSNYGDVKLAIHTRTEVETKGLFEAIRKIRTEVSLQERSRCKQLDKKMEQFANGCYIPRSVPEKLITRSEMFIKETRREEFRIKVFFVVILMTRCLKRSLYIQAVGNFKQTFH
jgi:hypothetical protein